MGFVEVIYVLPTEVGRPPRAVVGPFNGTEFIAGVECMWSRDTGTWTVNGLPVPSDLASQITEHAKSLGVEL
jgi:hypothetical protein